MMNVKSLSLIFLAISSCATKYKKTADLHVYNPKKQEFNQYHAAYDSKACKVNVTYKKTIDALDAVTNGWVCITPDEYAFRKAELKTACESANRGK